MGPKAGGNPLEASSVSDRECWPFCAASACDRSAEGQRARLSYEPDGESTRSTTARMRSIASSMSVGASR